MRIIDAALIEVKSSRIDLNIGGQPDNTTAKNDEPGAFYQRVVAVNKEEMFIIEYAQIFDIAALYPQYLAWSRLREVRGCPS